MKEPLKGSTAVLCRLLERHGHGGAVELTAAEKEAAEIDIKYAGFVRRQERQLAQADARQSVILPPDLDYAAISTLRMEAREKLAKVPAARCPSAASSLVVKISVAECGPKHSTLRKMRKIFLKNRMRVNCGREKLVKVHADVAVTCSLSLCSGAL